nr:hypothetical protein pmam_389 [Pithovirus mammoth]
MSLTSSWVRIFEEEGLPLLDKGYDTASWESIYNRSKLAVRYANALLEKPYEFNSDRYYAQLDAYSIGQFNLSEVRDPKLLSFGNADRAKVAYFISKSIEFQMHENLRVQVETARERDEVELENALSPLFDEATYGGGEVAYYGLGEIYSSRDGQFILNFSLIDARSGPTQEYPVDLTFENYWDLVYRLTYYGIAIEEL